MVASIRNLKLMSAAIYQINRSIQHLYKQKNFDVSVWNPFKIFAVLMKPVFATVTLFHSFLMSGCIQWQYNLSINEAYVVGWLKFSHSVKIFSLQIEYSRKLMRWSGKNTWFIAQRDTIFPQGEVSKCNCIETNIFSFGCLGNIE